MDSLLNGIYVFLVKRGDGMDPTIKDVARLSKVSIATVSRILNNKPGYSEETKDRVMKAIEELGYQPNGVARGLISKRTRTIGILVPELSSMVASEVIKGIEDVSHQNGSSVIVCNTDSNGKRTMEYLKLLSEKRVDGVIFASETLKKEYYKTLSEMRVPVVLLSTLSIDYQLPYIKVDDFQAAYKAVQYLIENGHEKIAMISGNKEDPIAGEPRIAGYKKALYDNGIIFREEWFVGFDAYNFENGYKGMTTLEDRKTGVTAIFASSDELAAGVLSRAYELGIIVPEQLSVIGYDNTKLAKMVIPPLTTVEQPLYQMGCEAAEMLYEMLLSGKDVSSRILPHKIIERKTVKNLKV